MKTEYQSILLELIDVPAGRLRSVKPWRVETLAADIKILGLLQPIVVIEEKNGRYTLNDGAHRLEAIRSMKQFEIGAMVTPRAWLKDQEIRLREIMANVDREDLTKLERAENLAEMKSVYEELYPETKHGGDRKSKDRKENQKEIFSFRSEAAEKTGLTIRAINLAVEIATKLTADSKAQIRGTWLEDHQAGLKALSEQPSDIQAKALNLLFLAPPEASDVTEAILLAEGRKPDSQQDRAYRTLVDKWQRFEIRYKRNFVTANQAEIISILKDSGAI